MRTVRPTELDERLGTETAPFVLDIRPENHYQQQAIDGSFNLPVYNDIRRGDDDSLLGRLDAIPQDRDVVVVCKMGVVAKRATKLLDKEGYAAATLIGGMSGWSGYQTNSIGYKLRSLLWRLR